MTKHFKADQPGAAQMTNQYPVSKTLRFELRPLGKTKTHIEQKGLIEQDEQRAEDYKLVKEVIDRYHKAFMEVSLNGVSLEGIEEYENLFLSEEKNEETFRQIELQQAKMRKSIAKAFKEHPYWKTLFTKDLIKKDLLEFQGITEDERTVIEKFKNFTTYFTGYHQTRENIYTDEPIHTAAAHRIVHENLPIFLENKKAFERISQEYPEVIAEVKKSIEPSLLGATLEDMFTLNYFPHTMTQTHIELYNTMIGGLVDKEGEKIQGFNEKINLYRQFQDISKRDLPNLKPLYKQILSDREALSWLPEAFASKEEMISAIDAYFQNNVLSFECCDGRVNILDKFAEIFDHPEHYDLTKIFISNNRAITDISQSIFGKYNVIKDALWEKHTKDNPKAKKAKDVDAAKEKIFDKKNTYFTIEEIQGALKDAGEPTNILKYFARDLVEHSDAVQVAYSKWNAHKSDTKNIKEFMDAILSLQRFLKVLSVQSDTEKDIAFYATFEAYFESLSQIVNLYNKVRNFVTKKPYSTEKFKLNFENSTLLDGWDVNKEPDNTAILFEKDGLYYLGIMDKSHNRSFREIKESDSGETYRKIDYKLLPGANKMLPKVFFSKSRIDEFAPSKEIVENYKKGTHKKGDNFNIGHCHALIDFFKASIDKHEGWKQFGFKFSDTSTYADLSGFYREVEQQGYKLTFKNIDADYIDTLVDEGKLYLFQIYNKDFSPYSKGTPNLHTLYWKALFDERNLSDVVYKLNGGGEIFYRKKSIEYSEQKLKEGHHAKELAGKFNYPIIKDRRFAFDKFQFHIPITMNFKAESTFNINGRVNEMLASKEEGVKIIGLHRGERHLIYLSILDESGKMIEQYSLNQVSNSHKGKTHTVDYNQKLSLREKERAEARVSWGAIENIKEIKEGYLSQIVHKVATLIVEHNAIVVMEDLNMEFKRSRQKIEKQVYQNFEKMLIDKLNYLVDKKKDYLEEGGVLNALQLTNKFESFEKMGRQNGFLFYVPAWNTSNIDPVTGFVNLFDTRYFSVERSKEFFDKFKSIRFNADKGYFEFEVDKYSKFNPKAKGTKEDWLICSFGDRIANSRGKGKGQWLSESIDLSEEFERLFDAYGIEYESGKDIKDLILSQDKKGFFDEALRLFKLTVQMKNSRIGSLDPSGDYIISPVMEDGVFFDSRNYALMEGPALPQDTDANGAYNVARKGLMILERIKNAKDFRKPDLKITNDEWMRFVQN